MDLRPTADRLRETLFDVLSAGKPDSLTGTTWIDLFAGTGAVGIEAISRGAGMVYFVDLSSRVAELIRRNVDSLHVEASFKILKQDSTQALRELAASGARADFVFLDPPYASEEAYSHTLEELSRSPLLKTNTTVIAEHEKRFSPGDAFASLRRYRTLVQGDAALSFYRLG